MLQQMSIRIAEIDAVAAAWPSGAAFDLDAGGREARLPSCKLIAGNRKGHVSRALSVMGRDRATGQLDRVQRLAAAKQQQNAVAADIVGMQPLILVDARKPEDLFVERTGAGEVLDVEHGLEHAIQARH